jgi:predicted nucleic acid-binding protein
MNLVDSSGWLEYLADSGNAEFFAPIVEDTENLIVSTVNLYEVFKRVLRQRGQDVALQAISLMQQGRIIDVTADLALTAARLSAELKLPMADSLILATARAHDAILWTQDSDFQGLDDVRFVKR